MEENNHLEGQRGKSGILRPRSRRVNFNTPPKVSRNPHGSIMRGYNLRSNNRRQNANISTQNASNPRQTASNSRQIANSRRQAANSSRLIENAINIVRNARNSRPIANRRIILYPQGPRGLTNPQIRGLTSERIDMFQSFDADESIVGEQCIVCMNDLEIGTKMVRLDCHVDHYLCKVCADRWFKDHNTCPNCRHAFD